MTALVILLLTAAAAGWVLVQYVRVRRAWRRLALLRQAHGRRVTLTVVEQDARRRRAEDTLAAVLAEQHRARVERERCAAIYSGAFRG